MIKIYFTLVVLPILSVPLSAGPALDPLEAVFKEPTPAARSQTYWMWMNGHVTREGITRDLEAMKQVGIGGAQIYEAAVGIPRGPVNYGSDTWVDLIEHAVREANRLGLELSIHNAPGYSGTGGPWVTPEQSMQVLVWSESVVTGPGLVTQELSKPYANLGFYQDTLVLAYPSLPGEEKAMHDLLTKIVFNGTEVDKQIFIDGDPMTEMRLAPDAPSRTGEMVFEFSEPFVARAIQIHRLPESPRDPFDGPRDYPPRLTLETSDDGTDYRTVCHIPMPALRKLNAPGVQSFPQVKARFFRVTSNDPTRISDVFLQTGPRLASWNVKANYCRTGGSLQSSDATVLPELCIDPTAVHDLTDRMDSHGRLVWNAPSGTWTVLRIGHTTTGEENAAAPEACTGLECDKFSRKAVDAFFNHLYRPLLERIGVLAGKSLKGLLIDSWEAGIQNWTATFPEEFKRRRGYDLRPYVLAMTGRIIGDIQTSEQFLWDVRRCQADLVAEHYYGQYRSHCHEYGLTLAAEPYGDGPFDTLQVCGNVDLTLGEFWVHHTYGDPERSRMAGSSAHTWGQTFAAMEAYTGHPLASRWTEYPYAMKAHGDWMFCNGVNRLIFHTFAHQPYANGFPGMTMGPFGTHLNRNNTWWNQSSGWMQYLTRVQSMLQQGRFVADLCYFVGESPGMVVPRKRTLNPPAGYAYDVIHREVLLKRMNVKNGHIVLPDGMSYRLLFLPDDKSITLSVLQRIRDLVSQGMWIVGPRPEVSPGLSGQSKDKVRVLAQEMWSDINATTVTERAYGQGRVFWGMPVADILEKLDLKPDFEVSSTKPDTVIHYTHRQVGDADVYFVSNGQCRVEDVVCSFRVTDKQPEFWHPDSGRIQPAAVDRCENDRVTLPIRFDPSDSVFVVFRKPADRTPLQRIVKDNVTLASTQPFPAADNMSYSNVKENFTVTLWAKPDTVATSGRSFPIYPSDGAVLYGNGHAAIGCTVGTNGVRIYEQARDRRIEVLSSEIPLEGWTHLAIVYRDNTPNLYLNGKHSAQGRRSSFIVHPDLHTPRSEEQWITFFQGEMGEPTLFNDVLTEKAISDLVQAGPPLPDSPPVLEVAEGELLVWQNGLYVFDRDRNRVEMELTHVPDPVTLKGPWQVQFPEEYGAPRETTLDKLVSLHKHSNPGIRYFSGTATYATQFSIPVQTDKNQHLFLDLGRVEVIAEVSINGRTQELLWKPPYRVDITNAVKPGNNTLEVRVTNLWPNRLIGDEHLSPENDYGVHGPIRQMPDWYTQSQAKSGQRVTFTTWHHYNRTDPLLESGLIGPVRLWTAITLEIED